MNSEECPDFSPKCRGSWLRSSRLFACMLDPFRPQPPNFSQKNKFYPFFKSDINNKQRLYAIIFYFTEKGLGIFLPFLLLSKSVNPRGFPLGFYLAERGSILTGSSSVKVSEALRMSPLRPIRGQFEVTTLTGRYLDSMITGQSW